MIAPRARYPKGALPEGLRQIGHDKRVQDWQAANFPAEFKRVLIVGRSIWDAHATARDALHQHQEVQEVMCLAWVPWRQGAPPSVKDLLIVIDAREATELNVAGGRLRGALSAATLEWHVASPEESLESRALAAPDAAVRTAGYHVVLRWLRDAAAVLDDEPALKEIPALPRPPEVQATKIVCVLNAAKLLAGGRPANAPASAAAWAKKTAWEALQRAQMQPPAYPAFPPPMQIGQRGTRYEVTVPLLEAQARTVLPQSGRVNGVEFRPWADRDQQPPEALRATMLWLKLPDTADPDTSVHWKKLESMMDVPFAGVVQGDAPGRLGVRLWGPQPSQEVRSRVLLALGAEEGPQRVRLRVWGYPPLFGQAGAQGYAAQQREVARATGMPVDSVRVVEVTHLKYSGLSRPVFDLSVTGVDPQWKGATLPQDDARRPPLRWAVVLTRRAGASNRALGRRARLPTFAGPAAPPAAPVADADEVEEDMEEGDTASESSDIL